MVWLRKHFRVFFLLSFLCWLENGLEEAVPRCCQAQSHGVATSRPSEGVLRWVCPVIAVGQRLALVRETPFEGGNSRDFFPWWSVSGAARRAAIGETPIGIGARPLMGSPIRTGEPPGRCGGSFTSR